MSSPSDKTRRCLLLDSLKLEGLPCFVPAWVAAAGAFCIYLDFEIARGSRQPGAHSYFRTPQYFHDLDPRPVICKPILTGIIELCLALFYGQYGSVDEVMRPPGQRGLETLM